MSSSSRPEILRWRVLPEVPGFARSRTGSPGRIGGLIRPS